MSDIDDIQDDDDEAGSPVRRHISTLEAKVKAQDLLLAAGAAAQRELAFVKAGIDLVDPASKYFVKGYDGDLTPEAIRAAAEEIKLVEPAADPLAEDKAVFAAIGASNRAGEKSSKPVDLNTEIAATKSVAELDALMARQNAKNL